MLHDLFSFWAGGHAGAGLGGCTNGLALSHVSKSARRGAPGASGDSGFTWRRTLLRFCRQTAAVPRTNEARSERTAEQFRWYGLLKYTNSRNGSARNYLRRPSFWTTV